MKVFAVIAGYAARRELFLRRGNCKQNSLCNQLMGRCLIGLAEERLAVFIHEASA